MVRNVFSELRKRWEEYDKLRMELDCKEQEIINLRREIEELQARLSPPPKEPPKVQLPGMLISTMPKSGSVYIAHTLARSLGIELMSESIAHGFFPTYFLRPNILKILYEGNRLRQEHFDASSINFLFLKQYTDRMVTHFRDPRQATLSWVHHMIRRWTENAMDPNYTLHLPPPSFLEWSFEEQVDWHIDEYLPPLVQWLRNWLDLGPEVDGIRILFTTYEEFLMDEQKYFEKILDFYEIPQESFVHHPVEKTLEYHFRVGTTDEWKSVFTPEQQRRATAIIGDDLLNRFGW